MLSPSGLRLALHVSNVVSQAGLSTLGARHTIRKLCLGSGIRYKSSLLVEPNLQIRPLSSFISKGSSYRRWFQHKPPQQESSLSPPTPTPTPLSSKPSPLKKDSDFVTKGDIPTLAEQRKSDWGITKRLLVNVWPKNDWKTRWIVLLGFGLLVSSKVSILRGFFCLVPGETTDHCLYIFSPGTQCSSAANIQGHRGLAQRGYNGIFYGLVTRWVADPRMYVFAHTKVLILIFVII